MQLYASFHNHPRKTCHILTHRIHTMAWLSLHVFWKVLLFSVEEIFPHGKYLIQSSSFSRRLRVGKQLVADILHMLDGASGRLPTRRGFESLCNTLFCIFSDTCIQCFKFHWKLKFFERIRSFFWQIGEFINTLPSHRWLKHFFAFLNFLISFKNFHFFKHAWKIGKNFFIEN